MVEPTTTGEQPVSQTRDEIIKGAHRVEEDLLLSSKGHFEAARRWGSWHYVIGIPIVGLSALAGASALQKLGDDGLIAASLSLIVTVLSGLATFINAQEKVIAHQIAGTKYDALLTRVRLFRTIECSLAENTDPVMTDRLKSFALEMATLNESCPAISRGADRAAKKSIEAGEAEYRIDKGASPR